MRRKNLRHETTFRPKRAALCLLLALCITATCVGLSGISAAAEEGSGLRFDSLGDGECCVSGDKTRLKGELVIPEKSPAGDAVTVIYAGAFNDCTELTGVAFPASLTGFFAGAFSGCSGLERITVDEANPVYRSESNCLIERETRSIALGCKTSVIPESVTEIGEDAFAGCTGLTSIEIPSNVRVVGSSAFFGCTALRDVRLSPGVEVLDYFVFSKCTSLKTVDLPSGLTTIQSHAFTESGLTNIHIPATVTTIGSWLFGFCTELEHITVDEANPVYRSENDCLIEKNSQTLLAGCKSSVIPESVTSIEVQAFQGITGLTRIDIPSGVTQIGRNVFSGCTGLQHVGLPDSLTTISENLFRGCTALTSIELPDGLTTIEGGAFAETGLTAIRIPASVTTVDSFVLEDCAALEHITVDEENPVYRSENDCLIEKDSQTLVAGCKSSVIPEGVKSIAPYAFEGCTGLTEIVIPSGVATIGRYAFHGCTGLTSVDLSDGVTTIDDAAFGATGLTAIRLPASVTTVDPLMLEDCAALEHITVDEANPVYRSENDCLIEKDSQALVAGCKSSVIPEGVKSIATFAFCSCAGLTEAVIPSSVSEIGASAFGDCTGLREIVIPENVKKLEYGAFAGCTGLKTVTIDSADALRDVMNADDYDETCLLQYATAVYIRADALEETQLGKWFTARFPSKKEVTPDGTAYLLYGTPSVSGSDEKTGVQISAEEGVLPPKTVLTVKPSDYTLENAEKYTAFDISLEADGVKIQPNGKVTVTLPIPAGFDKSKLTVYRVEADDSKTELPCTVAGEAVTFETDHFSVYVLAEKKADPSAGGSASSAAGGSDSSSAPSAAGGSGEQIPSPQTGDSGSRLPWLLLMGGSALALFGLAICRRRRGISEQ